MKGDLKLSLDQLKSGLSRHYLNAEDCLCWVTDCLDRHPELFPNIYLELGVKDNPTRIYTIPLFIRGLAQYRQSLDQVTAVEHKVIHFGEPVQEETRDLETSELLEIVSRVELFLDIIQHKKSSVQDKQKSYKKRVKKDVPEIEDEEE